MVVGRRLGAVVVSLHGTLDGAGAARLEGFLVDLVVNRGNLDVVVDMGDMALSSPASLACLDRAAHLARSLAGRLRLRHASEPVYRALQDRGMAGLVHPDDGPGAGPPLPLGPRISSLRARPTRSGPSAAPGPGQFSVTAAEGDAGTVLSVTGEVDVATAPALSAILASLDDGADRVVVDLAQVRFIGTAGIRVLARARHRLGQAGRELVIQAPRPFVRRLLELASVEETSAAVPAGPPARAWPVRR